MSDKFDIDEELNRSIASIVDEETYQAQAFVNKNQNVSDSKQKTVSYEKNTDNNEDLYDEDLYDEDLKIQTDTKKSKKVILIVSSILLVCVLIGLAAYFLVKKAVDKTHNYAYYNNLAYQYMDKKEYADAIGYFEKALSFDEGKTSEQANIDMLLWTFDCYKKTDRTDEGIYALVEVLNRDKTNVNAYTHLIEYYGNNHKLDELSDLYENAKNTGNNDILMLFSDYPVYAVETYPAEGTYADDIEVKLSCADASSKIYFNLNSGEYEIYTGEIKLKEGTSTIEFYSVNQYGMKSDKKKVQYRIDYEVPEPPQIMPEDTTISQSGKVKVSIKNYPDDAKVYYTLDGKEATTSSEEYNGTPFTLSEGRTVVNVLVIDKHGNRITNSKVYNVTYEDKYDSSEAEKLVWSQLIKNKTVDKNHKIKGLECELKYYAKKNISGETVHMYYFVVDGRTKDYFYGVNSSNGDVYSISSKNEEYILKKLK